MNNLDWLVTAGGLGLIGIIAYYFFGPKREGEKAIMTSKAQVAMVAVDAAYVPSEVTIKVNTPTEIVFDRRDKGDCTEWVIFDKLPTKEGGEIKKRLPEGEKTTVSFTPTKVGKYEFVCGMGMVHGKLVVTE